MKSSTPIHPFASTTLLCLSLCLAGCAREKTDRFAAYPYVKPLSSPGQKFSGLPPAVQSTVRAQAGAAQMQDIIKTNVDGEVAYVILFEQADIFPPLYVAPDGSVLYPETSLVAVGAADDSIGVTSGGAVGGLKLGDLPVKVVTTIQERAPTAEVAHINEITRNHETFYEVTFKDSGRNPGLMISEEGKVVRELP